TWARSPSSPGSPWCRSPPTWVRRRCAASARPGWPVSSCGSARTKARAVALAVTGRAGTPTGRTGVAVRTPAVDRAPAGTASAARITPAAEARTRWARRLPGQPPVDTPAAGSTAGGQHPWPQVLGRWVPGGRIGGHLLPGADVVDLVPALGLEPDERDRAAVGEPDLLAELGGGRCHVRGDAAGAQRVGHLVAGLPVLLVGDRHQHRRRYRPGGLGQVLGEDARDQSGDPDAQPHPGIGGGAVGGERVAPAT